MPQGIYKRIKPPWNKGLKGIHTVWNKGKAGTYPTWKLSAETKKKMSIAQKGKKRSPETIAKMKSIVRTKEWKRHTKENHHDVSGKNNPNYGKHHSKETRKKISIANGSKKGWITPLTKAIRKSWKMRQWRSDIFSRDDFTCQDCGGRGNYLEAHHIKQFALIFKENNIKNMEEALNCEELWNLNNGMTLCQYCHNKTKRGKKI